MHLRQIAIFGGSGAGAIVAQSIAALAVGEPDVKVLGFLNDGLPRGQLISGIPVIGPFASWVDLPEEVGFVAPLHRAKAMRERTRLVTDLNIPVHRWATVVDPRSAVAADAQIGPGCFVGPFASIGPAARLGAHCVIRAGAHVSHDCVLGDFVFVGTNAVLCGYGVAETGAYLAPNATVRDRCRVGGFAVVGLGAVVAKDVPDFVVAPGAPPRPLDTGAHHGEAGEA